jgi:phage terminase large subunit
MLPISRTAERIYCPYGGAREMWRSQQRWLLFDGPAGTGKTRAVIEKSYALCCEFPKLRVLWVRKTRASMTETVLEIFENKVQPDSSRVVLAGVARHVRSHYQFRNGSRIVLGGLDNVERIMSSEYDIIIAFEATEISAEDFEKLDTRLRNGKGPYHQIVCECNPSYPAHWLKLYADAQKFTRVLSRHADNPACTPEYIAALSRLSGHRRARLFMGQWAAAEGMVYDRWDEAVYVRDRVGVKWRRVVVSVDEGYANPCSVGLWLIDGDGYPHRADEWVQTGKLEAEVVNQVARYSLWAKKKLKLKLEAVIVDPSAAKLIGALGAAHLPVVGANNDVLDGIKTMQDKLVLDGQGRPCATVAPRCKDFRREIGGYTWLQNKDGTKRDEPRKVDDHTMDESRYFFRYLEASAGSLEVHCV